ncbi:MAG: hypothetical protein AVDCRST_MAG66-1118 [uncultured Pseudonocardia sp.]|uniref:Uncharacterized protein n=1 Tax=uncultured Pseudonocardia sp. TaxID=211455 RepID=A0A6J4NU00_9PSEU|nr:MAG: hypothetical protein AVDCRST_MAG66-1118 [uncultured Pseudonocardia sp.]
MFCSAALRAVALPGQPRRGPADRGRAMKRRAQLDWLLEEFAEGTPGAAARRVAAGVPHHRGARGAAGVDRRDRRGAAGARGGGPGRRQRPRGRGAPRGAPAPDRGRRPVDGRAGTTAGGTGR